MFIRPCYRRKNGKRHAYWALVESIRTGRGPRQQVVAYLGQMDVDGRLAVERVADGEREVQRRLPAQVGGDEPEVAPQWVAVDAHRVRVQRCLEFGGPWLGRELLRRLGLTEFLERSLPPGQEDIPWSVMAEVLTLCRFCEPSSELYIAEHFYRQTAMSDLLGVPAGKVNEQRLYRAMDRLLPHKDKLQAHLKNRLGELFKLDYDLLLYDVTSTYFEGQADCNPKARRGYSRDHRGDCKQVCIGLVVNRCGIPLGYEVFAGNRGDVTTFQEIIATMEGRYGQADRIWVVDRGMVSQDNVEFLQAGHRRYIIGTPKSLLRQFERQLLQDDWQKIREELEVKLCPSPDGQEVFILCRSGSRKEKEKAMHERFAKRIEQGLLDLQAACVRQRQNPILIAQRLGKLMGKNTRAAGLFETEVQTASDGSAWLDWTRQTDWQDWAAMSEGCYILRSNVTDWTAEELWKAYIQLTQAENAFRIHKSDLSLRPVWHQKEDRVDAHILVCFLAYVLWKTLGQLCRQAGLGDEPRRVLDELRKIRVVDVVMPTKSGTILRKRCVTRPTEHQAILLHRLGLHLPSRLELTDEMKEM
jgi:transposase